MKNGADPQQNAKLHWPCLPQSLPSILPGDLPFFMQAGASYSLKRAIAVIDPQPENRFDAFDRFRLTQEFCQYLRRDCKSHEEFDARCTECDMSVARALIRDSTSSPSVGRRIFRYRCHMGLEEVACIISIGGHRVMVVSGQFCPPEGISDIQKTVDCLGIGPPTPNEVSPELQASHFRFNVVF